MLINLEPQSALFVVLDQLAEVRIGGGVGGRVLFELDVVGVDFSGTIVFVEIQFGDFSFLLGDLFHITSLSLAYFPGSRAGKSGLKSDSEAVNDVLVVHGFSIGYKADLQAQDISHGLGGFLLCRGGDMGIGVQGEACGEVTQHAGHRLDVHTILESDGSEGVAEVMESDFRDARPFQHPLQHIVHTVRGDGTTVGTGTHRHH